MKFLRISLSLWLIAVAALVSPTYGQSDRGSIRGTVTDPNGAVVADAKVTVTNTESGEVREATTNENGIYNFPELRAANYRVLVESSGFKTATVEDVQVGVQVIRNADVQLEIGVGASVTVTSEAPVINTESPVQQRNVTEREVRELPLLVSAESGGRSPLSFIFLDSSVVSTGGGGSSGVNATNFRINGSQGLGQEILIDGATTRRGENGTFFSEVAPGPNAFQEFTLNTSSYSAEFGNSTGGVISFTIKSGGNDFHGEGYYFNINESLNANNTLNKINGLPRPIDRQRNYGFSIGGPVFLPAFNEGGPFVYNGRNKTFFFFNYEGYRTRQSESVFTTVPTARMRNGDFSELLTDPYTLQFFGRPLQIFNPNQAPGSREAFAGNIIPAGLISPVGRNFVNLFPLPNTTGPLGSTVFRNYLASSQALASTNAYTTKINQVISEKQQVNVSFIFRKLPSTKGGFPRFPGDEFVNQGVWDQTFRSYFVRLQHDYTFTQNLLNHLNLGFNRTSVQNFNFGRGAGRATALGLPVGSTQDRGLPLIGFPGYGDPINSADPRALQPGGSTFFDNTTNDNTVQISDFLTYTRGRHTVRFGGDVRRQQLNVDAFFDIGGNFNFRSNQTANVNDGNEGYPIASMLTGRSEFAFNSLQTVQPAYEYLFAAGFVQDDIKVNPKLTLNVGIRYDYNAPRNERLDRFRGFDPTVINPEVGRLGALVGAAGQGGLQAEYRGIVKPDRKNFGPRLGFAYAFNEKTVVRGGYGIYYSPVFYGNGGDGLLGYNPGSTVINGGLTSAITLDNFPQVPIANPNSQYVNDLSITQDYYDLNFKLGRVAQYDLNVQRELPFNFALSLSYIGNKGTRLRSSFNPLNSLPLDALKLGNELLRKRLADVTPSDRAYAASVGFPLPASPDAVYPGFNNQVGSAGTLGAASVAQALRPFPQYGPINNRLESQGQSSYNAFKADLQRRFTNGIQFGASYTFAKQITDAASDLYGGSALTGVLQNPADRRSLRSISPDDVRHSAVFSYVFELPFGRGRRFLDRGGIIDRLVGGFQINGIQRYRSGTPLTVFVAGSGRDFIDLLGYGGNLRPNLTGQPFLADDPTIPNVNTSVRYINQAAFVAPPSYTGTTAAIGSAEYAAFYANPARFLGTAAPTYNDLRTQNFYTEDLSIMKKTRITETTAIEIRIEFFNLFNRTRPAPADVNFDPNNGNRGNSGFFADIFQPRRIQLGGRFIF